MVTTEQIAQARQSGTWAKEAGRGIESCPMFGLGQDYQPMRDAWKAGWLATDSKGKK